MNTKDIEVGKIIINKDNPRTIRDEKFKKLLDSLLIFPEMLRVRPVVVSKDMTCLGGNMRTRALMHLAGEGEKEVLRRLESLRNFVKKNEEEKEQLRHFWKKWSENPTVPVVVAEEFSDGQAGEFMIKDNTDSGEWDWEMLANEWENEDLEAWGVDIPKASVSMTERLSGIDYKGVYYQPDEKPDIKLADCLNLEKFKAKIKALEDFDLSSQQKEMLKWFAYRFIKIDFEGVANYYAFNATEEEKRAMERLRLVLIDDGAAGYIEDDMLNILNGDLKAFI